MTTIKIDPAELAFQLASIGEKARNAIERVARDQADLNLPELNVLHALVTGDPPMAIGEIAEAAPLGTDAGRRVRDLEERGLADRRIDPEHELRRIVSPTGAGRNVHERVIEGVRREIASGLEIFTEEELRLLTRVLGRL